jgi:hypothetical protein
VRPPKPQATGNPISLPVGGKLAHEWRVLAVPTLQLPTSKVPKRALVHVRARSTTRASRRGGQKDKPALEAHRPKRPALRSPRKPPSRLSRRRVRAGQQPSKDDFHAPTSKRAGRDFSCSTRPAVCRRVAQRAAARDQEPDRYERAALKWLGRLLLEHRGVAFGFGIAVDGSGRAYVTTRGAFRHHA